MTSSTYVSTHISGTMLSLRNSLRVRAPWPDAEASICDEHSWLCPIKGKNCWSIRGPALQAYNTISDRIKQCLTERANDLYEDQDESSVPHWIDCLMVGRTRARARPYIMISCGQERFCRKVMGIVKESIWWRQFHQNYPGFGGFLLLRYAPRRMADANEKNRKTCWVYTSEQIPSLCGAPIFFASDKLSLSDDCAPQQATFGNFIYLDGRPFGLTVAHPLEEQRYNDASTQCTQQDAVFYMDDSDDESLPESGSTFLSASDTAHVSGTVHNEQFVRPRPLRGPPRLLGQLLCSSGGTPADGVDWALILLTQDCMPLQEPTVPIDMYLDSDGDPIIGQALTTIACPAGNVVPVFTTDGQNRLIEGILSASESLVCLSGSRQYLSLHSVILTEDILPGDCGKWIFDQQGNWYGHVVAGIPGTRIAHVALASQIIDSIQTRTGITSLSLTGGESHDVFNRTQMSSRSTQSTKVKSLHSQVHSQSHSPLDSQSHNQSHSQEKNLQGKGQRGGHDEVQALRLYEASVDGRRYLVQRLVDAKVDVNALCGEYGNALQAASYGGHEEIVKILVNAGADVNAQGGVYGDALQAASFGGHEEIVKILVNAGADVNAQGGVYSDALQAASFGGHEEIVKILVNAGADVNAQGGVRDNALQAASSRGHEKVVDILVRFGADVNARGGEYGNALQAASLGGHEKVVDILVRSGADINARGGTYGNALQIARSWGHQKVVDMLLEAGAKMNA